MPTIPTVIRNNLRRMGHATLFREGSVRPIVFGPLRGMVFRVNRVTQISPLYSGTERQHQRIMQESLRPGDVAIDVGANWGIHTLYMARLVGAAGTVVAAEPLPEAFGELRWHVQANHLTNVRALQCAVGARDDRSSFQVSASPTLGHLVSGVHPSENRLTIPVVVRSLDSIASELSISDVRLIKIDVEGGESEVLLGAKSILTNYHPILIVDLHNPDQDLAVARLLTDWGYSLRRVSGPPIRRLDRSWPDPEGVWGTIVARNVSASQ